MDTSFRVTRSLRSSLARCALVALAALPLAAAASAGAAGDREPPISAVLDSAGLVHDLQALALEAPRSVPPLFTIEFDSTGAVDTVRAMLDPLPASYAAPVAAAIRARLRPQAPSRSPVRTWIRAVAGPQARVDRPRLHENQPQLLNRSAITQQLSWAAAAQQQRVGRFPPGGYEARVRFRVLADGTPQAQGVSVTQSSGDVDVDREAVDVVQRMRFRPATVEGVPVNVWVELPIRFQVQAPRRPDQM
jgi:TonB family protein